MKGGDEYEFPERKVLTFKCKYIDNQQLLKESWVIYMFCITLSIKFKTLSGYNINNLEQLSPCPQMGIHLGWRGF